MQRLTELRLALEERAASAAAYLASQLSPEHGFPGREFYGLAFSAWLWCTYGPRYESEIRAALALIRRDDRKHHDRQYHWEFVRFGLQNALNESRNAFGAIHDVLGQDRFVYTRVANWTLLRASVRLQQASLLQAAVGHLEAIIALLFYQTQGGFIEDTRHRPTLQYHAFSTALLGMQVERSHLAQALYLGCFKKAVETLAAFTLPGGEVNYIGRGQGQSFGYASAILAFCLGAKCLGDPNLLANAATVLNRLDRFRRLDGSFPLVLRHGETVTDLARTPLDDRFLGWYSYNNYFDYLPFTAALLRRSAKVLAQLPDQSILFKPKPVELEEERRDDFLIVRGPRYTAVVLPPKAYLPSAQPHPFLEVAGHYPLPCYGGEVKPPGLYCTSGLPLPELVAPDGTRHLLEGGKHFRWAGLRTFVGKSALFTLRRSFMFQEASIHITDEITVSKRCRSWRLEAPRIVLYRDSVVSHSDKQIVLPGLVIECDRSLRPCDAVYYCAFGKLLAFVGEADINHGGGDYFMRTSVRLYITAASITNLV